MLPGTKVVSVLPNGKPRSRQPQPGTMALKRALSGHSSDHHVGHHLPSYGPGFICGSACPADPGMVLEHGHSNIYPGFPSLTGHEEEPSDSATLDGIPRFLHGDSNDSAKRHAGPSCRAVRGGFVMYGHGESQQYASHDSLAFNQPNLTAYPTHWAAIPMTMNYSQGSMSSADLNDRPYDFPTSSQDSYPRASIEYQNTPVSHSEDIRVHPFFPPPSSTVKPATGGPSIDIVIEDPIHPHTYRERRVRSREDLAKQKQDSRLLKTSGGACIWCYRSKKKCDPTHICQLCKSNRRKCIRDPAELSLLAPATTFPNGYSVMPLGRPSHETSAVLHRLGANVFQKAGRLSAVVNIRQSHGEIFHTWTMDLTSADLDLPETTKAAIDRFMAQAVMCVQCTQLTTLEEAYCSHPLVHKAFQMVKLFLAISCIAKTRVCTHPDDLDTARLAMLLVLITGSQSLPEMSQGFSVELYDALRRKDLQDSYCHGKYPPRTTSPLHPLWVACALYYRLIGGLLALEPDSPITRIFRSLEPHLEEIHSTMWGVVTSVSPCPRQKKKVKTKQILKEQIPVLSATQYFDLSFSTKLGACGDGVSPPMMLSRQNDPFLETEYDSGSLLNDELTQSTLLANNGPASQDSLKSSSTEPQVEHTMMDSISMSETSESPSIDRDVFDDILNPTEHTQWNWTSPIDSVLDEFPYCFLGDTR